MKVAWIKPILTAKIVVILLATFIFSSCAHLSMSNKNYPGPVGLPSDVEQKYSYKKSPIQYTETVLEERGEYTIKRIEFPVSSEADILHRGEKTISIDYYDVQGKGKTPVIIVLPILGGGDDIPKFFAAYFASHGYAAVIVNRNQKQQNSIDVDNLEITLKQIVIDHKLAIDWIETQQDLDPQNIGVFGISMGGINAALLTALDQRIKASIIGLAGGDLPYILVHSKEESVQRRIAKSMQRHNLSLKEIHRALRMNVQTDPIKYAQYIDARKTLVVLAVFDTVVPYSRGVQLVRAIGMPERIYLLSGHYSSLLYIFYIERESLVFFKKHFD